MPFISTVTTLQQGAKEPAFLVIMINTLPILMTTCFVQIPLFSITCPASIGFSTFVRDSACQTNKHEYGKKIKESRICNTDIASSSTLLLFSHSLSLPPGLSELFV